VVTAAPADTAAPAFENMFSLAPADSAQPILFNNREITTLRSQVMGHSPGERAKLAGLRIHEVLRKTPSDSVRIKAAAGVAAVAVGDEAVFVLTPYDLDVERGETLAAGAEQAAANLRVAIAAYREQRSGRRLIRAAAGTAIATGIAILLLWGLGKVRRRLVAAVHRMTTERLRGGPESVATASARHLSVAMGRGIDFAGIIAGLFLAYGWLTFCLRAFPYTRPWGEQLRSYLLSSLASIVLAAVQAIPGLFTVAVIFFLIRFATQVVNRLFSAIEHSTLTVGWIEPEIASPTRRIVNVLLWLFAVLLAYPYLPGSGSDAFKGLSVFVGLIVSLGSSGVVNQAMSGFVLMYARMLKRGDWVKIGNTEGVVTNLGLLSTKIKTRWAEEVSIPNSVVLSDTTKNFSRYADGLMIATRVSIGYTAPWRQVHAMLERAAARTQGVRQDRPPFVRQLELGDFYVVYELNITVESPAERIATATRLHANIQDEFNQHGVQILSPHYEADPSRPAIVPPDQWHASPAAPEKPDAR
jgi:small-conductance mechanosensitive channel